MNLKEKQNRLSEIKTQLVAMDGAENIDMKAYEGLLTEGETLKGDVETLIRGEALKSWADQEANPVPYVQFEGKAGTDLLKSDAVGNPYSADSEGWGITEKQWNVINEPSYKGAFMRFAQDKADGADFKTLTEGLDTGGGYLVPPDMLAEIVKRDAQTSSVADLVRTVPTNRDRLKAPKINYTTDDIYTSPIRIAWSGETGTTADATDVAWGEIEIPVWTGSFGIEVSRDLMEDTPFALREVLTGLANEAYSLGMEDIILNGTGVGQPKGVLFNPGGTDEPPTDNIGNPVTADELIGLVYGLPPQYAANAKAVVNPSTYALHAQLKDTANNYIYGLMDNTAGGLSRARLMSLLGHEVVFSAFMPSPGAANKVVAYGDWAKTYWAVSRLGLTMEPYGREDRSMLRANKTGFHFRFRRGGSVVQPRAMKIGVQS